MLFFVLFHCFYLGFLGFLRQDFQKVMRFYLVFTTFLLLLLFQCVRSSLAVTEYHHCIHDFITERLSSPEPDIRMSHVSAPRRSEARSSDGGLKLPERSFGDEGWKRIRIGVFTHDLEKQGRYCAKKDDEVVNDFDSKHTCTEEDVLTPEKKNILVNTILKEAVQLHSERLRVQPFKGKLVVPEFSNESICATFAVPKEHHTDGVPGADMVLYVSALPSMYPRSFAWAVSCATLDSKRGRVSNPGRSVVGVMNYAPKYILATAQRVRVAAHEIAHVLGFSVSEMDRLKMIKDVGPLRNKERKSVTVSSSNTLRETRSHYNCNTTEGMELEDQTVPRGHNVARPRPAAGGPGGLRAPGLRGGLLNGPLPPNSPPGFRGNVERRGGILRGPTDTQSLRTPPGTGLRNPPSTNPAGTNAVIHPVQRNSAGAGAAALLAEVEETPNSNEKVVAVEKHMDIGKKNNLFSHWKRRNAKDELMAGVVGAGYYTALTMAFFADM
ncbi:surface protease GP63, partial [Trypanosoma theileri]